MGMPRLAGPLPAQQLPMMLGALGWLQECVIWARRVVPEPKLGEAAHRTESAEVRPL